MPVCLAHGSKWVRHKTHLRDETTVENVVLLRCDLITLVSISQMACTRSSEQLLRPLQREEGSREQLRSGKTDLQQGLVFMGTPCSLVSV